MEGSTNTRPGYSRNEKPSFSNNQKPFYANNQRPSFSNNQRPSYPSKPRQFSRNSKDKPRKEWKMDISRLVKVNGSDTDYLWSSKDGKIKDVRLPCGFHRVINVSAQDCLRNKPYHCWECSRPGFLAPPMRECKGTKHQFKPSQPKRFPPRRQ